MIEEIVTRRYLHYEKNNDKHQMPDLIVIDGGKGQLNSAINGLHKLGIVFNAYPLQKKMKKSIHLYYHLSP